MLCIYVFARAGHGGATGVSGSRRKDRGAAMEEAATGSEPLHSPYPCHLCNRNNLQPILAIFSQLNKSA